MRLFTALTPPEDVQTRLHQLVAPLEGLRPVPQDQIHLTLVFIGEVNPRDLTPIEEALTAVEVPALDIRSRGLDLNALGQVWLRIADDTELVRLQRAIHDQLERDCGLRLPRRRFKAHITLARYPREETPRLEPLLAAAEEIQLEWPNSSFGLYSSQLHAEGARHELLSEFACEPSPRPAPKAARNITAGKRRGPTQI